MLRQFDRHRQATAVVVLGVLALATIGMAAVSLRPKGRLTAFARKTRLPSAN